MITRKKLVEPVVIKLGGSAITFKNKPYSINREALVKIAKALKSYYDIGGRIVLVHGGGSYGHYAVTERRTSKGVLEQLDVAMIQLVMLKLSITVLDTLLGHKLPVSLYPGHVLCRKSRELNCSFNYIIEDLENGLIPMTYGDIVYTDRGEVIISGDDLALWIASAVGASRVYFVMSEPGVIGIEGEILESLSDLSQVKLIDDKDKKDVTGGIKEKLSKALTYSKDHDVEIRLVGVNDLEKVLKGEPAGTLIKPK